MRNKFNLNECLRGEGINRREILENKYFIINEIYYTEYTSAYTGIEIKKIHNKIQEVNENAPLLIRYINRDFLKRNIFSELELKDDRLEKLFNSLKNDFVEYQKIEHMNLQKLIDFIQDEKGIYFILEFFDYTLKDYIKLEVEPLKNTKYPIELDVRKFIIDIFKCINDIHEKGLFFGTLLSPNEIFLKKITNNDTAKNNYQVKLPHPFLSYIFTLLELKVNLMNNKYPLHFPPDIYDIIKKRQTDNFESLSSILSFLDTPFDTWTSGFLVYQMLFDDIPFSYMQLESKKSNKKVEIQEYQYELFPWKISYEILVLITSCLQYHKTSRIQNFDLTNLIRDIERGNEKKTQLKNDLRLRIENMSKEKFPVKFNIYEQNQAKSYEKKNK